jgi:putative ABC transport system permease protein
VPAAGIVVGAALGDILRVDEGDVVDVEIAGRLPLDGVPIAGFVDEPLGTFAYTSMGYARSVLAGASGAFTSDGADPANTLLLTFQPGADAAGLRPALSAIDGVQAFIDSRALYDLAQQLMALFYAFIGVMIVLGGVLAFALIYNTMSANIHERSVELGVMRALGLSRRSIGAMVTGQNVLLTAIGLIPGLALGWLLAAVFMASFSSDMFSFELRMRPTTFLFTAAAILVVALLSQLPALRAVARLDLGHIVRERSV